MDMLFYLQTLTTTVVATLGTPEPFIANKKYVPGIAMEGPGMSKLKVVNPVLELIFSGMRRLSLFTEWVTAERRISANVYPASAESIVTVIFVNGAALDGAERITGRVASAPVLLSR